MEKSLICDASVEISHSVYFNIFLSSSSGFNLFVVINEQTVGVINF